MVTPESVAKRFRLGEGLECIRRLDDTRPDQAALVTVPTGEAARRLAEALAVPGEVVEEVIAAADRLVDDAEACWLFQRCCSQLACGLGACGDERLEWPSISGDPIADFFYLCVFMAATPPLRDWCRRRGIAETVVDATLADVGRNMAIHERVHGRAGLDAQRWLGLHFTGRLFHLGRLQFNLMSVWYDQATLDDLGAGFSRGDPALGVHIPEAGPLDPGACEGSYAWARRFFDEHFPGERRQVAICTSWLLDDQLAEYLPATSNIVRFQQRYEMIPGGSPGSQDVFRFVFRAIDPDPDNLPQRTTLEKAVVGHIAAGGEWKVRTGWTEL